jgi:leader peptidase (prepilin peptidase) / N-methyltransferase
MTVLDGLALSPAFLVSATVLVGLCVGSFLNVVAHRLPLMHRREWREEARAVLELAPVAEPAVSLVRPASHCPACRTPIKPWHNVPVLGWLWLRGRCAACGAPISMQYPLVEALAGLLSGYCAWQFGWSPQLAAGLVLTWSLLALAVIDLKTQFLFDSITLPLLWLGLLLSLAGVFATPRDALLGAAGGYVVLRTFSGLYGRLRNLDAMGHGDFKLFAALGAWFGWQALLPILLVSSLVGAVVGLALIALRGHDRNVPIPFGPYLALAGWIMLVHGPDLMRTWLKIALPS